jgi:CRP-like cAMP-binding protein
MNNSRRRCILEDVAIIKEKGKEFNKNRAQCREVYEMDALPRYLQYGEQAILPSRSVIFGPYDSVGDKPVFYIIAGLVRIEYRVGDSRLPLYMTPDTIFGLVEALAESNRLCTARAMEKTIVYRWDLESFFTAAGVSWELALSATTGMTRELRILNAEFGERIGALEAGR